LKTVEPYTEEVRAVIDGTLVAKGRLRAYAWISRPPPNAQFDHRVPHVAEFTSGVRHLPHMLH